MNAPLVTGRDVTFTNDIALVKLNRKVRFSDKVQPIKLPKGGLSYQGYQAYVSGWGIQGPYEGPSSRLKGAELVVSIILCLHVILKGQIISKGLLVSSNSPKKQTNEFVFTTTTNLFVCFLGEFEDIKKSFRNYLTFSRTIHSNIERTVQF